MKTTPVSADDLKGVFPVPPLARRLELELVDTRTFGSRIVYLAYRRREA